MYPKFTFTGTMNRHINLVDTASLAPVTFRFVLTRLLVLAEVIPVTEYLA